MRYVIEDTNEGFRLAMTWDTNSFRFDEAGGHGPIEALYAQTQKVWEGELAKRKPERVR